MGGRQTGRADRTAGRKKQGIRAARPSGRRVLYLSSLAVLCALAGVVLLANDRRNLHRLLGAEQAVRALSRPAIAPSPQDRAALRSAPAMPRAAMPRAALAQDIAAFSTFTRLSSLPAPRLCRFLAEAGLRNQGWRPGEIDPRGYECPSLLRLFSAVDGGGFDTAFADVKGDGAGRLLRLRVKVSARDAVNRVILDSKVAAIVEFVVAQSGWLDLTGLKRRVLAGGDFSVESHGLRISRLRERLAPASYNLVLSPVLETPGARNAYGYFLAPHGMLPSVSGNVSTPEQLHRLLHRVSEDGGGATARERMFVRDPPVAD